jgi:sugar phosphate isomerase/epimerase
LPETIDDDVLTRVVRETARRGIRIAAVSGTFNMVDPDAEKRRDYLARLRVLAEASAAIGAPVITLCSGSRDPSDMWRSHPGNSEPDAWEDMVRSMRLAVAAARDSGVIVAVEPEAANVVSSAQKARRLLDEIDSAHLGVVVDPANLVRTDELSRSGDIIEEAIDLLHEDIVLAHAKDISPDSEDGFSPAGQGKLDYDRYVQQLRAVTYDGPLILHSLDESDVDGCVAFLRSKLAVGAGQAE